MSEEEEDDKNFPWMFFLEKLSNGFSWWLDEVFDWFDKHFWWLFGFFQINISFQMEQSMHPTKIIVTALYTFTAQNTDEVIDFLALKICPIIRRLRSCLIRRDDDLYEKA